MQQKIYLLYIWLSQVWSLTLRIVLQLLIDMIFVQSGVKSEHCHVSPNCVLPSKNTKQVAFYFLLYFLVSHYVLQVYNIINDRVSCISNFKHIVITVSLSSHHRLRVLNPNFISSSHFHITWIHHFLNYVALGLISYYVSFLFPYYFSLYHTHEKDNSIS